MRRALRELDGFCRAVTGDYDPFLVCCLLVMLAGALVAAGGRPVR